MQKYLGVKEIEAEKSFQHGENGYAVKYSDDYISWSPRKQFEDAYLEIKQESLEIEGEIEEYQERVVIEAIDLGEKVGKLETFIDGEIFKSLPTEEQSLMSKQLMGMKYYLITLMERIKLFNKE